MKHDQEELGGMFGAIGDRVLQLILCVERTLLLTGLCLAVVYVAWKLYRRSYQQKLSTDGRHVLVTGCDSGFGLQLAQKLDEIGFVVFASCLSVTGDGARKLKETGSNRLHVLQLDVTSDVSISECLDKVNSVCSSKGLWALVNNAGIVSIGDTELCTMEVFRQVLEVNLFGVVRVTKACLPLVRKTKGRIINVTSVRGLAATPGIPGYTVSKFGEEGFNDSLRLEVRKFGVRVIAVEPGNFGGRTALWNEANIQRLKRESKEMMESAGSEVKAAYGEDYLDNMIMACKEGLNTAHPVLDPVVEAMVDALTNENPKYRYIVSGSNQLFDIDAMFARYGAYLPVWLMDYLVSRYRGTPVPVNLDKKSA